MHQSASVRAQMTHTGVERVVKAVSHLLHMSPVEFCPQNLDGGRSERHENSRVDLEATGMVSQTWMYKCNAVRYVMSIWKQTLTLSMVSCRCSKNTNGFLFRCQTDQFVQSSSFFVSTSMLHVFHFKINVRSNHLTQSWTWLARCNANMSFDSLCGQTYACKSYSSAHFGKIDIYRKTDIRMSGKHSKFGGENESTASTRFD